jgi:diadenosine tetraphosphate (Ap4A) HIT family hydrolase
MSEAQPPAFSLHPQLARESVVVGDLLLSRVLLMNNSRFPWLLLVPRRPGLRETIDLPEHEQPVLWREISAVQRLMRELFSPDKLNVAAIGNLVPQLHVHVIARFEKDEAWPKPVFGFAPPIPYAPAELDALISRIAAGLGHP